MKPRKLDEMEVAAWLLKCNPKIWDPRLFLEDGKTTLENWRLASSYRVEQMAPGDKCVLWVTGEARAAWTPGVWAIGEVTDYAFDGTGGEGSTTYWRDLAERAKRRPYIPVDLRFLDEPVARDELLTDRRFKDAEILRQPQMGNPLVLSPTELAAIEALC